MRGGVVTVSIPQRGGYKTPQRRAYERSLGFKQGQRFRAGIEGRISVLMRGRGMKRCRAEGAERFALFVGAAVLANNLMIIGAPQGATEEHFVEEIAGIVWRKRRLRLAEAAAHRRGARVTKKGVAAFGTQTGLCRRSNRSLFASRNRAAKRFSEARDRAGNSGGTV